MFEHVSVCVSVSMCVGVYVCVSMCRVCMTMRACMCQYVSARVYAVVCVLWMEVTRLPISTPRETWPLLTSPYLHRFIEEGRNLWQTF